jgi:homoserine/homoserine lactone efflux protein
MGGVRAALGVQLGASFYWLVSGLGLTAVLITSEQAFMTIKFAGAAYLVIMGAVTIANARREPAADLAAAPPSLWRAPFVQGLIGHLANPKAVLFYIALLPQFVTPGRTGARDLALLAATAMTVDLALMTFYCWLAARSGRLLRGAASVVWRERLAGGAQIAVGAMIAAMRRTA